MQVEIIDPQGNVSYRRPHNHPDVMEALSTPGYSVRGAEPKGEPQVRISAGLAASVVVNQALVDEIIRRARVSRWGLDEAEKGPDMDVYADSDIDALAQCLVSSWTAKYDLVSVFSAAMSVIQEKAANTESSDRESGTRSGKDVTD